MKWYQRKNDKMFPMYCRGLAKLGAVMSMQGKLGKVTLMGAKENSHIFH